MIHSPDARLAMISKAKALLDSTASKKDPHRAGLLVIFEKISIFPVSAKYVNPVTGAKLARPDYVESWKKVR